jgi:hypothetical protein
VIVPRRPTRGTLRALAFARATRPSTLTAVTVRSGRDTEALQREWSERDIPVQLTILDSPYRDITGPVLDFVARVRRKSPRDVVCVFIPEYVVGHWWEHLLHNQSALRLKARLLFRPGVMVTSVPWQLGSAEAVVARETEEGAAPWPDPLGAPDGRQGPNGGTGDADRRRAGAGSR